MRAWHGIGRTDFEITVAAGTGFKDINITGRIETVTFTKTGSNFTCSYAITDTNGIGVDADGPGAGADEVGFERKSRPCYGKNRVTLNSDVDGVYTVTLYGLVQSGDWLISTPT